MSLDLKSLEDAVAQLEQALVIYDKVSAANDLVLQKHMRAATIQAFEFTYELTFKMLKRHLEATSASPETIDDMTFDNVIREAFGKNVVCSDVSVWREYRKNRAITSHTYNEDNAKTVFECARDFLQDARYTLKQLLERNKSPD